MFIAMVCAVASASTLTLFEGKQALNWSDGVQIDGTKFADAKVGDIITVTTENGGFKLCQNYPWATLIETGENTGSYTITADALEGIKTSGVRVQGGEDVNLLSVTLSSDATQPAEKTVVATLLDTPASIGNWDSSIEVAGSAFAESGAKEGDYLRINLTATDDSQLQLCANSPSWHNILDCTDIAASKTYYDLQLTAEMLTDLEADKLFVQGKNITVKSVQIVREATTGVDGIAVNAKKGDGFIYSIDGKRLAEKPQHGIYILNGRKHLVR